MAVAGKAAKELIVEHLKNSGKMLSPKEWAQDFEGVMAYHSVRAALADCAKEGSITRVREPGTAGYLYYYRTPEEKKEDEAVLCNIESYYEPVTGQMVAVNTTEKKKVETIMRNSEHYYDPTAGKAIANVEREKPVNEVQVGDIWYFKRGDGNNDDRYLILAVCGGKALCLPCFFGTPVHDQQIHIESPWLDRGSTQTFSVDLNCLVSRPLKYATNIKDHVLPEKMHEIRARLCNDIFDYNPPIRVEEKVVEKIVEVPVEKVVEKIVEVPVKSDPLMEEMRQNELEYYKKQYDILHKIVFGKEGS